MRKKDTKLMTTNQIIMDTLRNKQPETVEQLIQLVQQSYSTPKQEIMKHILDLQNRGKLVFKEQQASLPLTQKAYLFSTKAAWYWTIVALTIATVTAVFTIPENAFPIVYARYLLGSIFVLFLPGFCLIKALFPTKEIDNIERLSLSIGTSLALFPITGLLLNYTPWGIRTIPVALSLLALTTILATVAVIREHEALAKETGQK